jgi:flagellar biosynthesis component FlhA
MMSLGRRRIQNLYYRAINRAAHGFWRRPFGTNRAAGVLVSRSASIRRPVDRTEETASMRNTLLTATAALALWAFAPMVPATPIAASPAAAQATAPATEMSDEQLRRFAAAALQVQEIGRDWEAQAQAAENEAEVEALREQAQVEMVQAVESEGLSVGDYNAIVAAADADPDIAARIQQFLIEESQGG